jgi:lysophospholipase L1-like esterase
MVSPLRTLGLLVLVGALLAALAACFPAGTVPIPATAFTPAVEMRIIGLTDVMPTPPPALKDIAHTLDQAGGASLLADGDSVEVPGDEQPAAAAVPGVANAGPVPADSTAHSPGKLSSVALPRPGPLPTRAVPSQDTTRLDYPIEYAAGRTDALAPFFRTLHDLPRTQDLVRVLHIGDSQLEGDRVTSYLRQRFQQQFGGCGPGLISIDEVNEARLTVQVRPKGPWKKYASYGPRKKAPHLKYSLLDAYFRFPPSATRTDSTGHITTSGGGATARYLLPKRGYGAAARPEIAQVLYRNPGAPFTLQLRADGTDLTEKLELPAADTLGITTVALPAGVKQVEAKFAAGGASPDVLGICLDCRQGVAVDNVSLRGSSCTEFGRMDMTFYGQQIRRLGVKLIVLEFGVNVGAAEASSYAYYERMLKHQLSLLRKAAPGVPVLVIGISDMSRRQNGEWQTRPSVPKVRDAQRNAAFATGCAFWDLYGAMGGENSMPSWVASRPSLAQPDYTHFSAAGARIVGELLWKAIIKEYDAWARGESGAASVAEPE